MIKIKRNKPKEVAPTSCTGAFKHAVEITEEVIHISRRVMTVHALVFQALLTVLIIGGAFVGVRQHLVGC